MSRENEGLRWFGFGLYPFCGLTELVLVPWVLMRMRLMMLRGLYFGSWDIVTVNEKCRRCE